MEKKIMSKYTFEELLRANELEDEKLQTATDDAVTNLAVHRGIADAIRNIIATYDNSENDYQAYQNVLGTIAHYRALANYLEIALGNVNEPEEPTND